jgi:hypothetical protein
MRWMAPFLAGLMMIGCLAHGVESASAQDAASFSAADDSDQPSQHVGYYYPKPQSVEHYVSKVVTLPESDRNRRQGFIIGMTKQMLAGQYAPSFAIFAKGSQSEKLIVVGLVDGQLNTVYRARALLAELTSVARSTSFFQQNTQPEESTFLDFMKLLGFTMITITDGRNFAHQVTVD